jgi:hypothetical protein
MAAGQARPEYVQLRSLESGQLVGKTACNSHGDFSFAGRQPGNYSVELVNSGGTIVGTSAAIAVSGGAATSVRVAPMTTAASASPAPVAPVAGSAASVVTKTAIAAGISGVREVARHQPSPSF